MRVISMYRSRESVKWGGLDSALSDVEVTVDIQGGVLAAARGMKLPSKLYLEWSNLGEGTMHLRQCESNSMQ